MTTILQSAEVREKWKENHETEYLAGAMAVPSWVTMVVIGADIHPRSLAQGRAKPFACASKISTNIRCGPSS